MVLGLYTVSNIDVFSGILCYIAYGSNGYSRYNSNLNLDGISLSHETKAWINSPNFFLDFSSKADPKLHAAQNSINYLIISSISLGILGFSSS